MEHTRFDALAKQFGTRLPRRGLLGLAAALTAAGMAGSSEEIDAKPKHRKKCPTGQKRCARGRRQPCVGCCSDADCGGNACISGACAACPTGQRACRGGCIAADACCADSECAGNRVCTGGVCECAPSDRLCDGVCINRRDCCGTDCPPTPQPPQPPTPTCTPENCRGCCDGTTCKDGDSQNFCGRDGVTCTACQRGEACDAGTCRCTGDEACIAGDAGLCRPDGTCVYRPDCLAAEQTLPGGVCNGDTVSACCSSTCLIADATCERGDPGLPCRTNADCYDGDCQFYVCV